MGCGWIGGWRREGAALLYSRPQVSYSSSSFIDQLTIDLLACTALRLAYTDTISISDTPHSFSKESKYNRIIESFSSIQKQRWLLALCLDRRRDHKRHQPLVEKRSPACCRIFQDIERTEAQVMRPQAIRRKHTSRWCKAPLS